MLVTVLSLAGDLETSYRQAYRGRSLQPFERHNPLRWALQTSRLGQNSNETALPLPARDGQSRPRPGTNAGRPKRSAGFRPPSADADAYPALRGWSRCGLEGDLRVSAAKGFSAARKSGCGFMRGYRSIHHRCLRCDCARLRSAREPCRWANHDGAGLSFTTRAGRPRSLPRRYPRVSTR